MQFTYNLKHLLYTIYNFMHDTIIVIKNVILKHATIIETPIYSCLTYDVPRNVVQFYLATLSTFYMVICKLRLTVISKTIQQFLLTRLEQYTRGDFSLVFARLSQLRMQ